MSILEDTNPRALKEPLAEIHRRTMVLPAFQRDVVWKPSAIQGSSCPSRATVHRVGCFARVTPDASLLRASSISQVR
jgi:hypothetical protein